jgi:hypothetical protein
VALITFLFSGCVDKEPIVTYEGCPRLDIYEIPDKILVKVNGLGKTNVYGDYSQIRLLGDTDIITTIGDSNVSIRNAFLITEEMLIDIIDYTASLRTGAEKYNAQILDKNATK